MSAIARWDAFLAQIEERHRGVRIEAEGSARAFIASIVGGGDYQPLSHQFGAINNRLQDLETKIIDTWNEKVDDAITGEGNSTAERDRQRAKGQALKDALDDARCELEIRVFAELARQRWHYAQANQLDANHEIVLSIAAIGTHAVAHEAATMEWRAMRNAERAMHAQRPPYSIESIKAFERAQITYYFKYLGIRSQFEPILARDHAMEVRSRKEQWYTLFADHDKTWVAAGRPRERI
jgi:hypothetical protein